MILVTHFACCHQYKGYWRSCPLGWSYFTVMPGLNLRAGGAHAPEFTFSAYLSRKIAPTISIGDLQVEMFLRYLGFSFSRYFTHAGQQEVNIGNGPPFFSRSRNSSDSAMVVKSAPKVVS